MQIQFYSDEEIDEIEDIKKCLRNLFSIPEGSMPLARGLGLSWESLDDVPLDMENDVATDIIEKVELFEKRASVTEVEFEHDPDSGETIITVNLERGEDLDELSGNY